MRDAVEIPLTKGFVALVDAADFEWLSQWKWYSGGHFPNVYAARHNPETGRHLFMHRFIMGAAPGQLIDHANRDKLDNRRANLRFCTHSQNQANSVLPRGPMTPYRGVNFHSAKKRWFVQISFNGKRKRVPGWFKDPAEAARAHDDAARELHGEFAVLNFSGAGQ